MIVNFFKKLSMLGIQPEYDFQLKKEIRLINLFNLCVIGVTLTYTAFLLSINQAYLAFFDFVLTISSFVALVFNHFKKHDIATYFTFTVIPLGLLAISWVYGRVGCEYYLISSIVMLSYLNKPLKNLVFYLVFYLILFIVSKYFETNIQAQNMALVLAPYFYYINISSAFIFVFIFMRMFILQYDNNRKELNNKNIELSEKNTELINRNEKIQILLKEISHRTKNNLQLISSLISIQSKEIDDPINLAILNDIKSRILSIALVHKKLYLSKQTNEILLGEYIQDLAHTVINTLGLSFDVKFRMESDIIPVQIDDAVHLGIMLNELITNAIEHGISHAKTKEVKIQIKKQEHNNISIYIFDSGKGINALNNPQNHEFGFSLVLNLLEQFKAKINIYEAKGNHIEITIPLSKHEKNFDN
jgi:two-component system, sensor histidine kinase PdtaS